MEKRAACQYPVTDAIQKRWSPVVFSEKLISDEEALTLFEAAKWAPSAYNEQPWKYIYAHRGTQAFDKIVSSLKNFNHAWAKNASMLVVSLSKKNYSMNDTPNFHHLYDTGAANAFMILQAISMGIYSHTMGGFVRESLQEKFQITDDYEIATVIALGYHGTYQGQPDDMVQRDQTPRTRKPLDEIAMKAE